MEILKNVVTISISLPNASSTLPCTSLQLQRFEYPNGVIDWVLLAPPRQEYKLEKGEWSIFNAMSWKYDLLTEEAPTWEEEYQELLLTQYPIEKRVRKIVQQRTGGSGEVLRSLGSDFDFVQLIKRELLK